MEENEESIKRKTREIYRMQKGTMSQRKNLMGKMEYVQLFPYVVTIKCQISDLSLGQAKDFLILPSMKTVY